MKAKEKSALECKNEDDSQQDKSESRKCMRDVNSKKNKRVSKNKSVLFMRAISLVPTYFKELYFSNLLNYYFPSVFMMLVQKIPH